MAMLPARVVAYCAALLYGAGSQAGINTSCSGGSPPAAASAFGYNCLRLNETFLDSSAIDTTDSGRLGFGWYTHNAFPGPSNSGTHWSAIASGTPTPSNEYATGSSGLTVSSVGTYGLFPVGTYGVVESLNTCRISGSSIIGKSFGPGLYVEVASTYGAQPGGFDSATQMWPIAWLVPTNALLQTGSRLHFVELDIYEGPYGQQTHDWNFSSDGQDQAYGVGTVDAMPVSLRIVPASLNPNSDGSLTGLLTRYGNGTINNTSTMTFGAAAIPTGGGSPLAMSAGVFSTMNSEKYCVLLSGSDVWPATFTSVKVWTR